MRLPRLKRRRRPFVDLRPSEVLPELPEAVTPGEVPFLGRFDEAALRRELEAAGVLAGLAARGYDDVVIRSALEDGEHRLWVRPRRGRASLLELRIVESTALAEEPLMRQLGLEVLSLLSVHWLAAQDPRARFTPERPRLPGQRYPGLGLSRLLYARAFSWARDWGKDGVLNFPEYFHNAVFYSTLFRFLSPRRQGRFEALRRDLAALPVAGASAAVDRGRVLEEPAGGVLRWEAGEMVAPLSAPLRAYLDSDQYARTTVEAAAGVRFRLARRPYLFSPPQSAHGHSARSRR